MVELTGKDLADNAPDCQLNKTVDEFYMSNKQKIWLRFQIK